MPSVAVNYHQHYPDCCAVAAYVQTTMSFVSVFDMTLGAFDVEVFRRAPYWLLPVSLFMLFMIMVRADAVSRLCWVSCLLTPA